MKIVFPVMGAENISVAYLSTVLKEAGHTVKVAFDRALFDDKQYFTIPFLANLFSDQKGMVDAIVAEKPDILALSCFSDNYQWCLDVVREVQKHQPCTTVWGGMHPTSCPDELLLRDEVDYVILGEGEEAMKELLEALENGGSPDAIPNLCYRKNGTAVQNQPRPLQNPEQFPEVDKSVFEEFIPMDEYYMTVTSKGCIASCSFCMQNFLKNWEQGLGLGKFLREKSVDAVLNELKEMKEKYSVQYIDIKNNVLSGNKKWMYEFLERYPKEVGLPFRIMGHPLMLQGDLPQKLKEANCHHIQMGIESMNPRVRKEVLQRDESNEQIIQALDKINEAGINFSADLIVGLPGESEEDLILALEVLAPYKRLIRASIFWLQYMPEVDITKDAVKEGWINQENVNLIVQGRQENYLSTGSPMEAERQRILKTYHILFRLLPILSERTIRWMLKSKKYHWLRHIPFQIGWIIAIDVFVSYVRKDYYAKWIMKWYVKHVFGKFFRKTKYVSD